MTVSVNPLTNVVRAGLEKGCREFTARLEPLGFRRTLKMFWTRSHPLTVDFIHFHRHGSTYGAPISSAVHIRVHFGIRVMNDDFVAAALNGPSSTAAEHAGRYHFQFDAGTGSTFEKCIADLVRFVKEEGERWFESFRSVEALLERGDSPLNSHQKELLRAAMHGQSKMEHIKASLKILGLTNK